MGGRARSGNAVRTREPQYVRSWFSPPKRGPVLGSCVFGLASRILGWSADPSTFCSALRVVSLRVDGAFFPKTRENLVGSSISLLLSKKCLPTICRSVVFASFPHFLTIFRYADHQSTRAQGTSQGARQVQITGLG